MAKLIKLSVGEPDFATPPHICAAARRAIDEGYTRYTPQPGFDDLRRAAAEKFTCENHVPVTAEQVVVSCGGKHSLYNVLQCLLRPGDEVIMPRPYWFAAPEQTCLAGGRPVFVDTLPHEGFQPDVAAMRGAVTPATRAILLNSPCNPTGAVYERPTLEAVADLALEHDLWIIADEVYERLLFDGAEHVSIGSLDARLASRVVTINSVSKTHAMTGWRIGYAAMPVALAEAVTRLQSYSTSGPCAVAQRAALAALTGDQSHVAAMVEQYARRRKRLLDRLARHESLIAHRPRGTFYIMVDLSRLVGRTIAGQTIADTATFLDLARQRAGLDILSAAAFGAPAYARLSFAISLDTINEGMDRLDQLLG